VAYIYALIILTLFLAFLHYFTELNNQQKATIFGVLGTLILFAYLYNTYKAKEQEKMYEIVVRYKQGKTIHCGNYDINSSTFTLSTGTYTFIGKKDTPYYAVMVSAYDCE